MKLLRTSASLLAFSAIALLAACGGGGGGGSVTPPGGGGGPSPAPTSTPTSGPTATPSPTPIPTSSPTPSSTVLQSNGSIAKVYDGTTAPLIFGQDNWQKNGASASDTGDGDAAGGYSTPTNTSSTIDGVTCNLASEGSVTGKFHVHTFLGIYVNGKQYAIPDAIGMQGPTPDEPVSGFTNACPIHTHAPSGIIHVEDPSLGQSFSTQPAQYNVQSLLDIWGQSSFSNIATAAAGFSGPVSIYVGTACPNNAVSCANPAKNSADGDDLVTSYTLQTASPQNILLGHHVAIWVIVGSLPAAGLPSIDFNVSN